MSTARTLQIKATSLNDTLALAEQIGSRLRGGEVIELISDLGGGKTAFVRGLAKGMGSSDVVHSPSFTLSNQYKADKLTLHHFDFYRLDEAGIMRDEIVEVLDEDNAVIAVEWANIVEDVLPVNHLTVQITSTSEEERQINFTYPGQRQYLFAKNT
jgi:tRNA threonylcarbamoyladenosine biosynthesis protein TsaE